MNETNQLIREMLKLYRKDQRDALTEWDRDVIAQWQEDPATAELWAGIERHEEELIRQWAEAQETRRKARAQRKKQIARYYQNKKAEAGQSPAPAPRSLEEALEELREPLIHEETDEEAPLPGLPGDETEIGLSLSDEGDLS